ncbi:MAG TPA: RloB family protein [Thermoanaerobaculia bacterium]
MPKRGGGGQGLSRRSPRYEPTRRILVLCEGEVTEPEYFRALRRASVNTQVEIVIEGCGEDPKALVERAAERKKSSDRVARERDEHLWYDEIWCVFDVDDHARLPDARQQARDNGLRLAVSNPCFEIWALLHFQPQTAYLERDKARNRLKTHLPDYDKELPFDRLRPGYEEAVRRAEGLDRTCERNGCPGDNPSTGVYVLTERIREEGKVAHLRQIREERTRRR